MSPEIVINGIYRHYKGMRYRVLSIAKHSETLEELVIYETLYENKLGKIWARPKGMWSEEVTVNGKTQLRFTLETEAGK